MALHETDDLVYALGDDERYLIVGSAKSAILFAMGGKGGWEFVTEGTLIECEEEARRLAA